MKIGAQMYTVHDLTQNTEGISECLKKIADIGYKSVQVSGTCKYEPEWLKEELLWNIVTKRWKNKKNLYKISFYIPIDILTVII